jgi:hypothetical protein
MRKCAEHFATNFARDAATKLDPVARFALSVGCDTNDVMATRRADVENAFNAIVNEMQLVLISEGEDPSVVIAAFAAARTAFQREFSKSPLVAPCAPAGHA